MISGNVLYEFKADRITSSSSGAKKNNAFAFIEPQFAINLNKNWSIKTDWRILPTDVITTRDATNPERYRTFRQNRGMLHADKMGLLVEQLKVDFQNDDLKFFAGKFDPTFGTAYRRSKRIGVFLSDIAEDYNLREKIGFGVGALLENSNVTFNSFFNDTTGLSSSALSDRGSEKTNDGLAGNTNNLSSYSVSMDGEKLFGVHNLFYNIGYRSLSVNKTFGGKAEKGYVVGSEYLYEIGNETNIIPFFEVTKINNFTGEAGRNALYSTFALMGNYSKWSGSVANISRHIAQRGRKNINDDLLQISVGYKFANNTTLDISKGMMKENGRRFGIFGVMLRHVWNF